MGKPIQLTSVVLAMLLWSCKPEPQSPAAIKDFKKELQPYLTNMVKKGIVMLADSSLQKHATDKELEQLARSEHPILRMAALREMLERKSFDHFTIIMEHLNDTALVRIAIGEGFTWDRFVTDDMIENARWKSEADKNKTNEAIITKHNHLHAAFTILDSLPPQEKYYSYIKEMASRNEEPENSYSYTEPDVSNYEYALYGLARFKKKEDIPFIKHTILNNTWRIGPLCFLLMKEFPDTAYIEVFEKLYPRSFYRAHYSNEYSAMNTKDYINSIAAYKQPRSASILDSILNKKQYGNCLITSKTLQDQVARAVWENPCEAYAKLRKQLKEKIKQFEQSPVEDVFIEIPWIIDSLNKTEERIQW